jgi:sulfur relay (sulfurtransferase) DsrF/TusC family protein
MGRVSVVIKGSPFNSLRCSEALRMSLGLTLADDNRVSVIFVGDAVYALLEAQPELIESPEVGRHLETLLMLGHELIAEEEALQERGLEEFQYPVERRSRQEVAGLLAESTAVMVW